MADGYGSMEAICKAYDVEADGCKVCPAGWSKGKAGMGVSTEGVAKYLTNHAIEL